MCRGALPSASIVAVLVEGGAAVREHFFERRATEEGVDPAQNRSERGFAQAPHPSSRSLKKNGRRAFSTTKPSTESVQATGAGISLEDAIAFAINMRNAAVSTIDATFVTSIAMTAATSGCSSAAASG